MNIETLKDTASYRHKEAFCLMRYQSRDGRVVEYLWNSRDGVTPFGLLAKDGKTDLMHVDWRGDQCRPTHVPMPGDRIFVDFTKDHAMRAALRMYERETAGSNAALFRETYGDDKARTLALLVENMGRDIAMRAPAVEIVTPEMHATFAAKR